MPTTLDSTRLVEALHKGCHFLSPLFIYNGHSITFHAGGSVHQTKGFDIPSMATLVSHKTSRLPIGNKHEGNAYIGICKGGIEVGGINCNPTVVCVFQ